MSSVSSWVLSIAGICLLSVVVDLILPDGKITKTIKNVFSYVTILVVILPLPKLVKSDFVIDYSFDSYELNIQDNFIYNVNQSKLDSYSKEIELQLNNEGIYGAIVAIDANIFDANMKVNAVYVDLYNVVIKGDNKNINIKTEVISIVTSVLNIDKGKVILSE